MSPHSGYPSSSTSSVVAESGPAAPAAPTQSLLDRARTLPVWVWACAGAMVSGAVMSACYWPVHAHLLGWVALVPVLLVLPRVSVAQAGLLGVLLGLVFYRVQLGWLFSIHGFIAGTAVLVFSVWLGLSFQLARVLMGRFQTALLWAVPLTFTGQEVLRCEGLPRLRFPFAAWGYSQTHHLWVAQIASLGGVYLLTFLLVLVNAAIAYALIHRHRRAMLPAVAAIASVIGLAWFSQPAERGDVPRIAAACVQAETFSVRKYEEMTRAALEHASAPKLVVLPEHAISDYARPRHPLVRSLGEMARAHGAVICVGAHTEAPRGAGCDYNNVAMLIGPSGTILHEQPKWVPLPFFSDGHPGRTQEVTRTTHGTIGTYVCYDGLFTDIPRRIVDLGAEILLVPNMDAERWPVRERWQHADMAILRSIELRRCAVRANSAGISQIIDAAGRVVAERSDREGPGLLFGSIYAVSERTPFVRGGYRFAQVVGIGYLISGAVLAGGLLLGRAVRRFGRTSAAGN